MIGIKRFEGKNLEDAIKKACEYFKKEKDELDIKVIDPGSSGFLGIRSKNSIIEATPKVSTKEDIRVFAESVTKRIISYISPEAKVEAIKDDGKIVIRLDVGKDIGLVIGKERQNLNALELLINLIVGKKIMEKVDIKLEVIGSTNRKALKKGAKSFNSRKTDNSTDKRDNSSNKRQRNYNSSLKRGNKVKKPSFSKEKD